MKRRRWAATSAVVLVSIFLFFGLANEALAHDPQDMVFANVGVDEHLSAQVPPQLSFTDQTGRRVHLADYLTGGPVILSLNYYTCPTLCPLVFRNLVDTVHNIRGVSLGKDYRIVTVSINPDEAPAAAREKAATTYGMLGATAEPERQWPFLMGSQSQVELLAKTVGVRYLRLPNNEFAHPSVLVVLTPAGKVSRYLYGMTFPPRDVKIALLEAAEGKIGGSHLMNQALLYCFHYDPVGRKYVLMANRVMTVAMLGVFVLLVTLLVVMWQRERKVPLG